MVSVPLKEADPRLYYRANDTPRWPSAILFGLQQTVCCFSGLLVAPFVVADIMCAGASAVALRVELISTTFFVSGIATLLQTTFGLRLAILQGPSFAFIPPLMAFASLPENNCNSTGEDFIDDEQWMARIRTVQGSLLVASLLIIVLGASGLIGRLAKMLGPITICPILSLLTISTVELALEKISQHWIGTAQLLVLMIVAIFLAHVDVPLPLYDRKLKRITVTHAKMFGLFPYLISIGVVWLFCAVLTWTNVEPKEGSARVDKNRTMRVLYDAPWLRLPYPGQFGTPEVSVGLALGFLASCLACTIETLGAYNTIARVSQEKRAPSSSANRGLLIEGFGCCLAASMGICVGITTYSENVALVAVTKVASRVTMQLAGFLLLLLGVFSKVGAVIATIPDPCIGAVLIIGMSMIFGVGLSSLQSVDLRISRNLTIMGFSILIGLLIPKYFHENPLRTGVGDMDEVLEILLNIPMFVGGLTAFLLDNTVGGVSISQRGLKVHITKDEAEQSDGYAFPVSVARALMSAPVLHRLPFMPSMKTLQLSVDNARRTAPFAIKINA